MPRIRRRTLLSALAAAALAGGVAADIEAADPMERGARKLRILILGGTLFTGRHLVRAALARGHTVTLFNRGKSNPGSFPDVEQLHGDRGGDLGALKDREWDAVIDTSGYLPANVRASAELLAPRIRQYLFISSVSVYESFAQPNDESSPLATTTDESAGKVTDDNYGALKALCEKAVERPLPGRSTILRPGYIVGPDDYTDRFTYWPVRVARGGAMLAPGVPDDPLQFIDVRDLAAFGILCLERQTIGLFNAVQAPRRVTMGQLLDSCRTVARSDASWTWVSAEFLAERKLLEGTELPIWSPPTGQYAGAALTSSARAEKAGLKTTPLNDTIHDTLAWHRLRPPAEQARLKAGLEPEVERRLLEEWRAKRATG